MFLFQITCFLFGSFFVDFAKFFFGCVPVLALSIRNYYHVFKIGGNVVERTGSVSAVQALGASYKDARSGAARRFNQQSTQEQEVSPLLSRTPFGAVQFTTLAPNV